MSIAFLTAPINSDNVRECCDALDGCLHDGYVGLGTAIIPEYLCVDIIENLFSIYTHKKVHAHYRTVFDVIIRIISTMSKWAAPTISRAIMNIIQGVGSHANQTQYAYLTLDNIVSQHPLEVQTVMMELVPVIAHDVHNISPQIRQVAVQALEKLIKCSGNRDLDVFIPAVLEGLMHANMIESSVESLSSCVFVQNVETPALSVLCPILLRGLKHPKTSTKRKTCTIIDNMCQLVEHPRQIAPFYSPLLSALEYCRDILADPEARNMCNKAINTLKSTCSDDFLAADSSNKICAHDIQSHIASKCTQAVSFVDSTPIAQRDYAFQLLANMAELRCVQNSEWTTILSKFLSVSDKDMAASVAQVLVQYVAAVDAVKCSDYIDEEAGENLYRGVFSLAYGSLTLLNNVGVHLKRNRFYGLLGPNNCGKTTLMRSIANEQIDGFPKKDELRTIFVEHEIQEMEVGEDAAGFPILNIDLCGVEWVVHCCNEMYKMSPPVTKESVEKVMESIGFGNAQKNVGRDRAADMNMLVTTYSGGWKMKMQLCAATLMNADILMLDEPTGHLDVTNVAWIKSWLSEFKARGGSVIATSHDPAFLNEMCTHIIDFQNRKLKMFTGQPGMVLHDFVKRFPEKDGYFALKNDMVKFQFPEPGPLENIKSMSRHILKMKNVTFTYPGRDAPTVVDVNLECSRISRVGVLGANGAGKSTAIKLLIGELKPNVGRGEVYKHPGMRIAYIAQHAFHHLEKHMFKTPTQYIMWRFAGNEDMEGIDIIEKAAPTDAADTSKFYLSSVNGVIELKLCRSPSEERQAVHLDRIDARRENKKEKTREYEVHWKGRSYEDTMWVKRDVLLKMGAIAMVQRHDEKEAVMAGLASKTLTTKDIEKHFSYFGIDTEQANHTLIKSLSGGQKVKVVLAASLWQNPHLVILDEPTNYLDRDGLGALTAAINEFNGGVVIISHNREFTNAVSQEKWIMEKGRLRKEGESLGIIDSAAQNAVDAATTSTLPLLGEDKTVTDSCGNVMVISNSKVLTDKEKKRGIKDLKKKLAVGKKRGTMTEDEMDQIEDEILALEN